MKEGQLKSSNRSGCLMYLALIYAFPMLAALAVLPLGVVYLCFRAGEIGNGLFVLAVEAGAVYLFIKYKVLQCLCFPSLSAWGLRVWYMISNFRHWQKMYNPL